MPRQKEAWHAFFTSRSSTAGCFAAPPFGREAAFFLRRAHTGPGLCCGEVAGRPRGNESAGKAKPEILEGLWPAEGLDASRYEEGPMPAFAARELARRRMGLFLSVNRSTHRGRLRTLRKTLESNLDN